MAIRKFVYRLNDDQVRIQKRLDVLHKFVSTLETAESVDEFTKALDGIEAITNAFDVELGIMRSSGAI